MQIKFTVLVQNNEINTRIYWKENSIQNTHLKDVLFYNWILFTSSLENQEYTITWLYLTRVWLASMVPINIITTALNSNLSKIYADIPINNELINSNCSENIVFSKDNSSINKILNK